MIIAKWIAVIIIVGIFAASAYAGWYDLLEEQRQEIEEEIKFERNRETRNARVRNQTIAIAKQALIIQCENVNIGNWRK